ncbi:MAG: hypothetical protein P8X64_02935 [Anaerolineales bacterium]
MTDASRNASQDADLTLRCPACHAKVRDFKQQALGRNVQIEGTCHRCRTRIFAIRRGPGAIKEGQTGVRKRVLDYIDQAA